MWTDGTPFDFDHWDIGEPDGGETENCVQLIEDSGNWIDAECDQMNEFVCKYTP